MTAELTTATALYILKNLNDTRSTNIRQYSRIFHDVYTNILRV